MSQVGFFTASGAKDPAHTRPPPRLHPPEPAGHRREQVIKPRNPRSEVITSQYTPSYTPTDNHAVLLSY
jgi:hypothetical protein